MGRVHYDEKYVNVKGKYHYDLNAIDSGSKFILSELLVEKRTLCVCKALLKKIKYWCSEQIRERYHREKKKPRKERKLITFVSDKFSNYKTAWQKLLARTTTLCFGVPIACKKYGLEHNNNPIERYNREIGRRTDANGPFQSLVGARGACALRRITHNYITPHDMLNGKTPAQAAQMHLQLGKNKLLNLISLAKRIEMTIK